MTNLVRLAGSDPFEDLLDIEKNIRSKSIVQRLHFYASPEFERTLEEIGKILKILKLDGLNLSGVIFTGHSVTVYAKRTAIPAEDSTASALVLLVGAFKDTFLTQFEHAVGLVSSNKIKEMTQSTLTKIDSGYSETVKRLVFLLPEDFDSAKARLDEALNSFAAGRKEEAALKTRKAWETCVNFALTKLPKKKGLESLRQKSIYVLESLQQGDDGGIIVNVKDLYERKFLHEIESDKPMKEPEIPFYIALTLGFLHLVASGLSKTP